MKVLGKNILECYELWKKGEVPNLVFADIISCFGVALDENEGVSEALIKELPSTDFYVHIGGDIHLLETFEDLHEISTTVVDPATKGWASLVNTADAFDIAKYLGEGTRYDRIAVFMNCWNDDGGPLYYVPKAIADQCPNVDLSVKLTSTFWGNETGLDKGTQS